MFPSYQLQTADSVYHSFKVEGVLFIVTDTRSYLSEKDKSFFGSAQKTWINNLISGVKDNNSTKAVIITTTQVWNYNTTVYENDFIQQNIMSIKEAFNADKKEIGDFIQKSGINYLNYKGANYKPILMVIGETMLAFDDGLNNKDYGKFPTVVCGNVDGSGDCKGGPFSYAYFTQASEQYCNIRVVTNMTLPNAPVCILTQGLIRKVPDEETKDDEMVFFYNTCDPEKFKGFNRKCPIGAKEKLINFAITLGANIFLFLVFFVWFYKLSAKAFNFTTLDSNAS